MLNSDANRHKMMHTFILSCIRKPIHMHTCTCKYCSFHMIMSHVWEYHYLLCTLGNDDMFLDYYSLLELAIAVSRSETSASHRDFLLNVDGGLKLGLLWCSSLNPRSDTLNGGQITLSLCAVGINTVNHRQKSKSNHRHVPNYLPIYPQMNYHYCSFKRKA